VVGVAVVVRSAPAGPLLRRVSWPVVSFGGGLGGQVQALEGEGEGVDGDEDAGSGDVGASAVGDAEVGAGGRGCVVDTVPDHGDGVPGGHQQAAAAAWRPWQAEPNWTRWIPVIVAPPERDVWSGPRTGCIFMASMGAAALPARAGQGRADRDHQAGVRVGSDELNAGQAAGGEVAEERQPAGPVLTGGGLQAQDLAVPVGVDAGREQRVDV